MVLVLTWLGITSVLLDLIPVVAIAPILLCIGMLIGAQAFQESPHKHAPAIALAFVPHLAAWGKVQIDGALTAAGTSAAAVGFDKLAGVGVLYPGLAKLGEGAILTGPVLPAIAVFIIEREFLKAAGFALADAALTFFGFMHGEAVGFAVSPTIAAAHALVAAGLVACAKAMPPVPVGAARPAPAE